MESNVTMKVNIMFRYLAINCVVIWATLATTAHAQTPQVYSKDGQYLGNLSSNKFDPNSTSNPYGQYGSPYSAKSINNPYGQYGSPYSPQGASNPYAAPSSPNVVSPDGTYLGRLNANKFDSNSVSNSFGPYGSPYSATSVNNQYSNYGSPYSPNSATNPYAIGSPQPSFNSMGGVSAPGGFTTMPAMPGMPAMPAMDGF